MYIGWFKITLLSLKWHILESILRQFFLWQNFIRRLLFELLKEVINLWRVGYKRQARVARFTVRRGCLLGAPAAISWSLHMTYTHANTYILILSLSLTLSLSLSHLLTHFVIITTVTSIIIYFSLLLFVFIYYLFIIIYYFIILLLFIFALIIIIFLIVLFFFNERGEMHFMHTHRPVSYVGLKYQVELPSRYSLPTKNLSLSRIFSNTVYLTSRNLFSHNTKE